MLGMKIRFHVLFYSIGLWEMLPAVGYVWKALKRQKGEVCYLFSKKTTFCHFVGTGIVILFFSIAINRSK
jgi:hypothetical protein